MATELKKWLKELNLTTSKNYTDCLSNIKILSTVAISMVCYNRKMFPADAFIVETYEGQNIPLLKSKSNYIEANYLYSQIAGFHEALEKQYLSDVVLGLYEGVPNLRNYIESYSLSFVYRKDKLSVPNSKPYCLKEATLDFFRKGVDFTQFDKLPENTVFKMYLSYYTDTPEGYGPPGFIEREDDYGPWNARGRLSNFVVGQLSTEYIKMVMESTRNMNDSNRKICYLKKNDNYDNSPKPERDRSIAKVLPSFYHDGECEDAYCFCEKNF